MTCLGRIQRSGAMFWRVLGPAVVLTVLVANGFGRAIDDPAQAGIVAQPLPENSVKSIRWPSRESAAFSPQYFMKPRRLPVVTPPGARVAPGWDQQPALEPQTSPAGRQRSTGRKILGALVGATGGFFAGGYIGAKIEGDCNCDDPGLRGAIIGAPIGAVTGGILGYKFLF